MKKITDTKSVENEYAHLLDPNTPPLQRLRILDAKLEAIFGNIRDTQIVEKQFENLLKPMREEHIVYSLQVQAHWLFLPTKISACIFQQSLLEGF